MPDQPQGTASPMTPDEALALAIDHFEDWSEIRPDIWDGLKRLRSRLKAQAEALRKLRDDIALHTFVCTKCGRSWRAEPEPVGRACECGYMAGGWGHEDWVRALDALLRDTGVQLVGGGVDGIGGAEGRETGAGREPRSGA